MIAVAAEPVAGAGHAAGLALRRGRDRHVPGLLRRRVARHAASRVPDGGPRPGPGARARGRRPRRGLRGRDRRAPRAASMADRGLPSPQPPMRRRAQPVRPSLAQPAVAPATATHASTEPRRHDGTGRVAVHGPEPPEGRGTRANGATTRATARARDRRSGSKGDNGGKATPRPTKGPDRLRAASGGRRRRIGDDNGGRGGGDDGGGDGHARRPSRAGTPDADAIRANDCSGSGGCPVTIDRTTGPGGARVGLRA